MFDRPADERCRKCVVDYEKNAVPVCNFSDSFDVGDVAVRVSEGLSIYHLSVRLNGSFKCLKIIDIYNGVCNALSSKRMCNQIE